MSQQKIEFIAEIGLNHNGKLDNALQLINAAKAAGADVAKFQTFIPDRVFTRVPAEINELALPFSAFERLKSHCEEVGIEFMSTPGDLESLQFLVDLGVKRIKIGSDDLTYAPLVEAAFKTGKPVLLSTGMATLREIEKAIPTVGGWFPRNWTLLHCVSLYPCPPEKANLRAIQTLAYRFHQPAGYSDHCDGTLACIAAAALGAIVIEKHIWLPHLGKAIDHAVSADPIEFENMIDTVRVIETMHGDGFKGDVSAEEKAAAKMLRKGPNGKRPDISEWVA